MGPNARARYLEAKADRLEKALEKTWAELDEALAHNEGWARLISEVVKLRGENRKLADSLCEEVDRSITIAAELAAMGQMQLPGCDR